MNVVWMKYGIFVWFFENLDYSLWVKRGYTKDKRIIVKV